MDQEFSNVQLEENFLKETKENNTLIGEHNNIEIEE